jgi:hypothetical protein
MHKDFHYYCIALTALAAGYSQGEAKTIAYASQFVDDETIDTPVRIRGKSTVFEPIRTAYQGIEYVLAFLPRSQKEVLVPFHFIPKNPFGGGSFSYRTERNSGFAQTMLADALKCNGDNRLHRIGVALHTFADTWAHQGFSGVYDNINEVDDLQTKGEYGVQFPRQLADVLNINIGHICALSIPDYPYEVWGCKGKPTRANQDEFIMASSEIFRLLLAHNKDGGASKAVLEKSWLEAITPQIMKLFSILNQDADTRCREWTKTIRDLSHLFGGDVSALLDYDKNDWRDAALAINVSDLNEILGVTKTMRGKVGITQRRSVTDWDRIDKVMNRTYKQRQTGDGLVGSKGRSLDMRSGFEVFTFKPGYERSDWYRFQTAAKEHRNAVLAGLPK